MTTQESLLSLLELYIEEDDDRALAEALARMGKTKLDITGLLHYLENFRGDPPRKRRAIMLIRKQLGLSIIPGPVCRHSP